MLIQQLEELPPSSLQCAVKLCKEASNKELVGATVDKGRYPSENQVAAEAIVVVNVTLSYVCLHVIHCSDGHEDAGRTPLGDRNRQDDPDSSKGPEER